MVLDDLVEGLGLSFSRSQMNMILTDGRLENQKIIFAKPTTFMNESGKAVAHLSRYYRIPLQQHLIIYDDLDLPLGKLRLRPSGGSGGHRGMDSIIHELGEDEFPRLRIGIGRPPGRMEPADYVLQDFSDAEKDHLEITIQQAADCAIAFVLEGIEPAMTQFNGPETNS
jgi:PTH1 family peptidyl-tRNA hydrolase